MTESSVVIRNLLSAAANAPLYGVTHPHMNSLLNAALCSLQEVLESNSEMSIDVFGNELVIDSKPQPFNMHLSRCAALLSSHGIARLRFRKGVSLPELTTLITRLALPLERGGRILSSENIRLGRAAADNAETTRKDEEDAKSYLSPQILLQELMEEDAEVALEMHDAVRRCHRKLDIILLSGMVATIVRALQGGQYALIRAALDDKSSFSHAAKVTILTIALAMAVGTKDALLQQIGVAAMLHDVGKMLVPEEILLKKGNWTEKERCLVREHPVHGAKYLLDIPGLPGLAVLAAFEHHIGYDLTGYPAVSAQWRVNSCSHMVAICDFFDASRTGHKTCEQQGLQGIGWSMRKMMGKRLHPGLTLTFIETIIQNETINNPQDPVFLAVTGRTLTPYFDPTGLRGRQL